MSKPVPRSVRQTVHNLLTVLAQQGDLDAINALRNSENLMAAEAAIDAALAPENPSEQATDPETDEEPHSSVKVILECPDGMYVVSSHGTSFLEGGRFLPEDFGEPGFEWPENFLG